MCSAGRRGACMFSNLNIGTKINLILLIVVFLPLVLVLTLIYVQVKQNTEDIVRAHHASLAEEVGKGIDMTIFSAHAYARSVADNPVIKSFDTSLEEKLTELRKLLRTLDVFQDLLLLDTEGKVLASTTYGLDGRVWNAAFFEWKGVDSLGRVVGGETCAIQEQARSPSFLLMVLVATPVRNNREKVTGIVAGRLKLEKIWETTDRIDKRGKYSISLIDKNGTLMAKKDTLKDTLARTKKLEPDSLRDTMLTRQSGSAEYLTLSGHKMACSYVPLVGYQDYKGLGWVLAVNQESEVAFRHVDRLKAQVASFSIGCFVLLFVLGGLLSRNIVLPLDTLVRATHGLAKGNLGSRAVVKSKDEIGELAESFNKMAGDLQLSINAREVAQQELQKAHDFLEIRVQERTAELAKSNEQLKIEFSQRLSAEERLRESERRRVMLESLGAATHHLSQPATVLLGHLSMLRRDPALGKSEQAEKHLGVCIEMATKVSDVLHKLHHIDEYKTTDYLTKEGDEAAKDQIIDLGLDVPSPEKHPPPTATPTSPTPALPQASVQPGELPLPSGPLPPPES